MLTTTKHKFVTTVPNDGISSRVQPTAWNDEHALTSHTRADIPTLTITQNTFMVSGFSTAGDHGAGAVYTSVGAGSSGPMAIQDITGKWFQLTFNGFASVGWFGAKCDGITDDSAAVGLALARASGLTLSFPGVCLIATGQTATGLVNTVITGPGQILLSAANNNGSYSAITFTNCTNLVIDGLKIKGTLNNQQYSVAVTGATIATSFNPATWTLEELTSHTPAAANVSASKASTTVSVALTGDAGLNINRGVLGSAIGLTAGNRYVIFCDTGFMSGYMLAAPRFYNAAGAEYVPGNSLLANNYEYLTGTTSIQFKVGTGRFTHTTTLAGMTGYVGAQYDVSKLSVLQLVNDFATTNFATFVQNPVLYFVSCNGLSVVNCRFNNLWMCASVDTSNNVLIANNVAAQCIAGWHVNESVSCLVKGNSFDGTFLDDGGVKRDQVVTRQRAFGGNLNGGSKDIAIIGNDATGACWGMEFVNTPTPTNLTDFAIIGNNIQFAYQGISVNTTNACVLKGNVVKSFYAFASGGIETADDAGSNDTQIVGNTVRMELPYGQTCVGITPYGPSVVILGNNIKAAVGVGRTNTPVIKKWIVKGNNIEYANAGIWLRNVQGDVVDNDVSLYIGGFVEGIAYSPETTAPLILDMTVDSSADNFVVKGNKLEMGPTYTMIFQHMMGQIVNNTIIAAGISAPFSPNYGIYGALPGGVTGLVQIVMAFNSWFAPAYGFNNAALNITGIPAGANVSVGSNIATLDGVSAGTTSLSGVGTINRLDNWSGGLNSTGAGTPALGANCPANILTAPYKWIRAEVQDTSTVWIPAWK